MTKHACWGGYPTQSASSKRLKVKPGEGTTPECRQFVLGKCVSFILRIMGASAGFKQVSTLHIWEDHFGWSSKKDSGWEKMEFERPIRRLYVNLRLCSALLLHEEIFTDFWQNKSSKDNAEFILVNQTQCSQLKRTHFDPDVIITHYRYLNVTLSHKYGQLLYMNVK